jgi:cell division septation protein DedD
VSDSSEPSYYEIALTNRQVVISFVILLVFILAVFLSGVWVGRSGQAGPTLVAQLPASANSPGVEELKEFSFAPEEESAPGSGPSVAESSNLAARPTPSAGPATLAEEIGSAVTPPAASGADEPVVTPSPPAPTRPTPAPTTKPAESKPAESEPAGGFVIQVFSTKDEAQAKRTMSQLKKAGHKAYLSPVAVGTQTMYRVRIGPFQERSAAETSATKVKKQFKLDTWVTANS